jgi:hypothetical protein
MTWPLPDRPKLPPAPTRQERDQARQARLDAIESEHGHPLPKGVRRRDDGSWHTPYWRRDEVWIVGAMIFSIVLLVAFIAYWTNGAPTNPSDRAGSPGPSTPAFVEGSSLTPFWWVVAVAIIVFVVAMAGWVTWSVVSMLRDRGVRYEDVSAEEQARRREVARLLKVIEPPVPLEDAQRQLGGDDGQGP